MTLIAERVSVLITDALNQYPLRCHQLFFTDGYPRVTWSWTHTRGNDCYNVTAGFANRYTLGVSNRWNSDSNVSLSLPDGTPVDTAARGCRPHPRPRRTNTPASSSSSSAVYPPRAGWGTNCHVRAPRSSRRRGTAMRTHLGTRRADATDTCSGKGASWSGSWRCQLSCYRLTWCIINDGCTSLSSRDICLSIGF